jgi:hypothetical protein
VCSSDLISYQGIDYTNATDQATFF